MTNKFVQSFATTEFTCLVGKVLVATPNLDESIFERSLIFICAHDAEGVIGVIFNKPNSQITTKEILAKTDSKIKFKTNRKYTIYTGGPVDEDKLFILSSSDKNKKNPDDLIKLTLFTNANAFLLDIISGENKNSFIACNGFCGWGPNQIEQEINENSWIVTDLDIKTIFTGEPTKKWSKTIKQLGINNPERLVPYSGNA